MNLFTRLLAACFICCRLSAQDPYFVQDISADKAHPCRGEQVLLSAQVVQAAFYEFQFRDPQSGEWIHLSSGNTDTTLSVIEHLFPSVQASLTVRIVLKNMYSQITGAAFDIQVHFPVFDIQPQDLVQCNGGEVIFRASASGTQSCQWESSTGGQDFSPLSLTTKFRDVNTPNLKITGIINNHHGLAFRCRVKDAYGCEAISEPAALSVNQLSTAVSPTTATAFCEGDTARFFPSAVTGTPVSFQWYLRKTGETTYAPLAETGKFTGTSALQLQVNGILPHENSYRVKTGFTALAQNLSGHVDSTVCYLESTRANYTVHPRPAPPGRLDSLESCGPASFLITAAENYSWYEDTLTSPVKQNAASYQTPVLAASRTFYYAVKDTRLCESYRLPVKVRVHPVPYQVFSLPDGVCPEASRVTINLTEAENMPRYIFAGSPDLEGFTAVDSLPFSSETGITLPLHKNTGIYTLELYSKNEHCISPVTVLPLEVFPITRISSVPAGITVCEGEKIRIQPQLEGMNPVSISWYRNGMELQDITADSLVIAAAKPGHAGDYRVSINGRCGQASASFPVQVLPATTILAQPENTTVCENSKALFRVKATGEGPLSYQWFINNRPVPGNADSLLLSHTDTALNQARVYCTITSACLGEISSDTVVLTVHPLPPLPAVRDTLVFCTSAATILLSAKEDAYTLNWFDPEGARLPVPQINTAGVKDQTLFVSQTDANGCESLRKPFMTRVYPSFQITVISEREELCLTGHFNRQVQLAVFTNAAGPAVFRLWQDDRVLDTNSTGNFWVSQPGLYTIESIRGYCSATDSLVIRPAAAALPHPPAVSAAAACPGGTVIVQATSGYSNGTYYWWTSSDGPDGFSTGSETGISGIVSDTTFYVSYGRQQDDLFCESPRSRADVKIMYTQPLRAGRIAENNTVNCAGYNPPLISSSEPPQSYDRIQWQFTENCENPQWQDIAGATALTYNPGVLQATTCYRRRTWNRCDTLASNTVTIHIVPDPGIVLSADKNTVLPGDSLTLHPTISGGAGNCTIQWQINRVSSAASNPNWTDAGTGEVLHYAHPGSDITLHFRARISCDLSSCNLAVSNPVSVRFLPRPVALHILSQTQEMVNCYGSVSQLQIRAEGEGTPAYRWQRMLPDDSVFTDITENNYLSGARSSSLRIAGTGNAESPHQSRFRCMITDASREIYSTEIPLTVNRLTGSLPNQTRCTGNDLHADLAASHTLIGSPLHYEWQHRTGTGQSWTALKDTGNVSGSTTPYLHIRDLPELDQEQYRCAVTFSSSAGSCVETTNLMTLKVGAIPEKPGDMDKEVCQAEKPEKITLYPPDNLKAIWYDLHGTTALSRQPEISTDTPGDYFMQYAYITDKKCESPRALVRLTVHPAPSQPVNTTPNVYDESESLTFSAEGKNLKWYRTKTLKQFELYPPTFTSTGKKSYYVSQTNTWGCESERLLISSEIQAVFGITTQPRDQANCDGNTVTFTVRTAGGSDISYQWQQEYQGLFINIAGATERDYKIADAGKEPDISGSRYRCIVRSGEKQLVSEPAMLQVNRLRPSLPSIDLCPGTAINFSRYRDSVTGTIEKMEWQKRTGNTYNTVFEAPALTEAFTPEPDDSGSYRLRITFRSSGGTCVRNSNVIHLTRHPLPDLGNFDSVAVCEGVTVAAFLETLPAGLTLLNRDSSRTAADYLLQAGDRFLLSASNDAGCSAPFRAFQPQVLPRPAQDPVDTLIHACRFSPALNGRTLMKDKTWWQLPGAAWSPELDISTEEAAVHLIAFKTEGENGCFSRPARMTLQISPCYFAGQTDTCIDFPAPGLQPGTWNYFYRENGEIFAAVHPQGVQTGRVHLKLTSTAAAFLDDPFGNRFYPRSLSFNTSRKLSSKVKIRYYMSQHEIHSYPAEAGKTLMLLHRNELPADCTPGTAILWVKDTLQWLANEDFPYLEFETEAPGQYFLWENQVPKGRLTLVPEQSSLPGLAVEDLRVLPFGRYLINKSSDGTTWQEWASGISITHPVKDVTPYIPETYYQLAFDFGNRIMAALDMQKAEISGRVPGCVVPGNPFSDTQAISLYFPDLDKSSTKLLTLNGQEVPLMKITEKDEYYRIDPVNRLAKGIYYLTARNRSGVSCTKRIIKL